MHLDYRPYRFSYLRRHPTEQVLEKVVHRIDKDDKKEYEK